MLERAELRVMSALGLPPVWLFQLLVWQWYRPTYTTSRSPWPSPRSQCAGDTRKPSAGPSAICSLIVEPLLVHLYQYFGIATSSPACGSVERTMPLHGSRVSNGELPEPPDTAGTGSEKPAASSVRDSAVVLVPSHSTP